MALNSGSKDVRTAVSSITLGELLNEQTSQPLADDLRARIVTGLSADSRQIAHGHVFFAAPGARADGLAFAGKAIDAGAIAVVCERAPEPADPRAAFIVTHNVRAALSAAAAKFFPRQPATIAAVTGTSGKTSVSAFVRQIWLLCGHGAAALGTTGVIAPSGAVYGSLTTPDPVTLHRTLDELARDGVTHLAMEASSHGLDQHRLDGVRLTAAGFTNLSRDHLDYHPDLESYFAAKMRLFENLLAPGQGAVIDADSDVAHKVSETCRKRGLDVLTVGRAGQFIKMHEMRANASSIDLDVEHAGKRWNVRLPLSGEFMASNALVAAGLCLACGSDAAKVFPALEQLKGAPGRLERVGERNGAPVLIDYAHKPDALEKVLLSLRASTRGRLIVVFGCGGDRDPGKRPLMGEIATRVADVTIVTDDNPRSEDPARIRAEILASAKGAIEIGDRARAIMEATAMLRDGDTLVVAGKGHETGQIIGAQTLAFSDHEAVRSALRVLAEKDHAA
ncbi:MAG: UDP-N-acetylmuramoyl-L-alanyl-D-glutamate--2,6-diaminopimelate ligase [Alphaproteobacteria bacterium]|nr:UDP-N-acetylmuramoyl-L-alanyl-D-glutamate--2,6-diaminopimelate ligase [Alphaproteobacteria bacterium]